MSEKWCSPGQVAACVHSWVLAVIREPGSSVHCHLWAAVFVCGQSSSFFGWSWWRGGRGLWLVLGVVLWLLLAALLGCGSGWLKKGSDVTYCDISFLAVYTQSWSNLGRGEIQPSGLVSVLLSSGKAHLPTSTSENHLSLAEVWQSSAKLSRNYSGTIKTLVFLRRQVSGFEMGREHTIDGVMAINRVCNVLCSSRASLPLASCCLLSSPSSCLHYVVLNISHVCIFRV